MHHVIKTLQLVKRFEEKQKNISFLSNICEKLQEIRKIGKILAKNSYFIVKTLPESKICMIIGAAGKNSFRPCKNRRPKPPVGVRRRTAPDGGGTYSTTVIALMVNRRLASTPVALTTLPSLSAKVLPSPFTRSTL